MQEEKDRLRDRLFNKANIFLAIHFLDSWVEKKGLELLDENDLETYAKLHDKFNYDDIKGARDAQRSHLSLHGKFNYGNIKGVIEQVQKKLKGVMDSPDVFFQTEVYFDPKKYEDGKVVYRPLHSAKLIDQIAMISMLQVLVYDHSSYDGVEPSEYSRILPSSFYGNRVSFSGKRLFEPWQEQYHLYTEKINITIRDNCITNNYKYEVNLDLKNFFPSINPKSLYSLFVQKCPAFLTNKEKETLKQIIWKLLIFELSSTLNDEESEWYVGHAHVECKYTKGLPQGLPHTYFLANMFMTIVKQIYEKEIPGEMFFYVDDSVIFTAQDLSKQKSRFSDKIQHINESLKKETNNLLQLCDRQVPKCYYEDTMFVVKVHEPAKEDENESKSYYVELKDIKRDSGEWCLHEISRLTSNMSIDLYSTCDNDEKEFLYRRSESIIKALNNEIKRIEGVGKEFISTPKSSSLIEKSSYKKRLIRYKKFFEYRKFVLWLLLRDEKEALDRLEKNVLDVKNDPEQFIKIYKDESTAAELSFSLRNNLLKDNENFKGEFDQIIKSIYSNHLGHSYINKSLSWEQRKNEECDTYAFLKGLMRTKYDYARHWIASKKNAIFKEILKEWLAEPPFDGCKQHDFQDSSEEKEDEANPKNKDPLLSTFPDFSIENQSVRDELVRKYLNAVYSWLMGYEVSDSFILAKEDDSAITYKDVRVLAVLRNPRVSKEEIRNFWNKFEKDEDEVADYSLLQVLKDFFIFVREAEYIDKLILIHKYCCDTWKQGSKILWFYTLHNQEHAVKLIKLSIRWMHVLSALRIKENDYFNLFASCYLHDISMVTYVDPLRVMNVDKECELKEMWSRLIGIEDNRENDARELFKEDNNKKYFTNYGMEITKALVDAYKKVDLIMESTIRGSHAKDSAREIMTHPELSFLSKAERERIADICSAHGDKADEVYKVPNEAEGRFFNDKLVKIYLRISDVLDISRGRVSELFLRHNLENMEPISRFHWLMHMLTESVDFELTYDEAEPNESSGSYIESRSITETITIKIQVGLPLSVPYFSFKNSSELEKREKLIAEFYEWSEVDTSEKKCIFEYPRHGCDSGDQKGRNAPKEKGTVGTSKKEGENNLNNVCFLCFCFVLKNEYLMKELRALHGYLDASENEERIYYKPKFKIEVIAKPDPHLHEKDVEYLSNIFV